MMSLKTSLFMELAKYFLISGGIFLVLDVCFAAASRQRTLRNSKVETSAIWREFWISVLNVSAVPVVAYFLIGPVAEHSKIYNDWHQYGAVWMVASVIILFVIYDLNFYWLHRFFHLPAVYKRIHYVHHTSTNPTALGSHTFHLVESFANNLFFMAPLIFILPLQTGVIFYFAIVNSTLNALAHSGHAIYPNWLRRHRLMKYIYLPEDHYAHHQLVGFNYGFYFRWWDVWMKTNAPRESEAAGSENLAPERE